VSLEEYDDLTDLRRDVGGSAVQAGLLIPVGYADDLAAGRAAVEVVADPTSEGVASALATIDGAVSQEAVREAAVAAVAGASNDEADAVHQHLRDQHDRGLRP
jgi:hypothetical protein